MAVRSRAALLRWSTIPLVLGTILALGPGPASAAPPSTVDSASVAAGWLATQMVDGNRLQNFGTDDVGITVDGMLAFAAAGAERDRFAAALAWITTPDVLTNYIELFTPGLKHAGETAKVVFAIEVAGGDPTNVNGVDLVAALRALQQPSGLFQNADPAAGDDTNAFDQSLAILALARTPGGAPAAAVTFLAGTACASGGFPINLSDPPATCTGHVDATGLDIQALLAAGSPAATTAAVAWLIDTQQAGGGYLGAGVGVNANSAGLAAEALREIGTDAANAAADRAVAFLTSLQVGCDGAAADRGGIAYGPKDPADPDNTGFLPSTAPRATTQAILGLAGVPLGTLKLGDAKNGSSTLDCPTATPPPTTIPGAGGILPVTGSSVRPVVFGGAGLVVVGAALLVLARRRRGVAGN